jgi:predicted hotdog family 3-hydroxylacyl-ACP dehydratase
MLDRSNIAKLIPHTGSMCLLERVVNWNQDAIACTASSHRDPANPLAQDGQLPILCGIEYAAQAMAVHGALTGAVDLRPRAGYLASVRDVKTTRARLDDLAGDLTIEAQPVMGDGSQVIYSFSIAADGQTILSGRAAVILEGA